MYQDLDAALIIVVAKVQSSCYLIIRGAVIRTHLDRQPNLLLSKLVGLQNSLPCRNHSLRTQCSNFIPFLSATHDKNLTTHLTGFCEAQRCKIPVQRIAGGDITHQCQFYSICLYLQGAYLQITLS